MSQAGCGGATERVEEQVPQFSIGSIFVIHSDGHDPLNGWLVITPC